MSEIKDELWKTRTKLLVGETGLEKLLNAHVLIIGMGGVGSYAAEAIVRAGVGNITIIDGDIVDPSNRNRQLPALYTTHGLNKIDVMKERMLAINPNAKIIALKQFINPDQTDELILGKNYDFVIEAIDSISPKLSVIKTCYSNKIKFVSSMGAGGKMDPTQIQVVDISKTYNCNLAHAIRKRLRQMGIKKGFKAVFSPELPLQSSLMLTDGSNYKKSAFGTISYLPAVFGLTCASVAIRHLVDWNGIVEAEKQKLKVNSTN